MAICQEPPRRLEGNQRPRRLLDGMGELALSWILLGPPMATTLICELLVLLPLGLLAGVLSGLLGVGGGLVFSPLLLLLGLEPHQALATSTLAIVPTTLGGTGRTCAAATLPARNGHRRGRQPRCRPVQPPGTGLQGSLLLASRPCSSPAERRSPPAATGPQAVEPGPRPWPLPVGVVAGLASGLLGVGGGLLMVPLLGGWGCRSISRSATAPWRCWRLSGHSERHLRGRWPRHP